MKKKTPADIETIGEYRYRVIDGELHRAHLSRPESYEFVTVAGRPAEFCLRMARLKTGLPEHGSGKTAPKIGVPRNRGRALDNVFIERLWWSVKYEWIYLHEFATAPSLEQGLKDYFRFYCHERPHQALDYRTPAAVYRQATKDHSKRKTNSSPK